MLKDGYHFCEGGGGFTLHTRGPKTPDDADVWWRAEDRRYANYDPWDDYTSGSYLAIELTPFIVDRYTPKGVWLRCSLGSTRFVLGKAVRQFAVPTKNLALADLVKRKERHVLCAKARWQEAEAHLAAARLLERKAPKSGVKSDQA